VARGGPRGRAALVRARRPPLSGVRRGALAARRAGERPLSPFRPLEHDAELGLEIEGESLEEVFADAALGFAALLVPPAAIAARSARRVTVTGEDHAELLVRWLAEWHYLYETEGWLPAELRVTEASAGRLAGEARGGVPDVPASREIKAVTRHQALVERAGKGWRARVIFDV
jgi:SHS2 domain-containing protein